VSAGLLVRDARKRPTSVLVYARNRASLDPVTAAIARQIDDEPLWIEVMNGSAAEAPEAQPNPAVVRGMRQRFEFCASELLPDHGLANLALWVGGRSGEQSEWVQEAEDLSWLPWPLQDRFRGRGGAEDIVSVVVCRAERLMMRLPLGVEDVRRLLHILARRKVSLVTGLLVRPLPMFFDLFDYVVRVRSNGGGAGAGEVLLERKPA
jgi:hypothetical protein